MADRFSPPKATLDWWKQADTYNEKPNHASQREMLSAKKYWAKPDELYMNEFVETRAPPDPFKRSRSMKAKKLDEQMNWDKPNSVPYAPPENED